MNTEYRNDEVVQLYLDDIIPNRFQPREVFDEKALKELAVSIKEHGVIQPIIVRKVNDKYEIIAGERRYKASALAGLTKIPAIIRNLDDKESSKVALLENLQRKNLTPIEEARTYQKILEIDEMTQEELAKTMGKSQSAVANKLRLLSLPDEVQESLLKEQISERHARALLNIPEPQKQTDMLRKIISNKMSVRAVEEEIKQTYAKDEVNQETNKTPDNNEQKHESISVPTPNSFINTNPLMPTNDIIEPNAISKISEESAIPPIGPGLPGFMSLPIEPSKPMETSKFINYGEIDDDNDDEPPMKFNSPTVSVDINSIRNNAVDISSPKEQNSSPSADLDSLLNLQNMSAGAGTMSSVNKFITPAEEIIKQDTELPNIKAPVADYFRTTDFIPNIPSGANLAAENGGISGIAISNYNSPEQAMNKIRDVIAELKSQGVAIHVDEMNFDNSFQFIIKIEK